MKPIFVLQRTIITAVRDKKSIMKFRRNNMKYACHFSTKQTITGRTNFKRFKFVILVPVGLSHGG